MVFVAGEPGIGKTALCDQLRAYAARTELAVFVGHCFDIGPVGVPYQAIVEALRDYVRGAPVEVLSSELGEAGSDIADVFPEAQRRLGINREAPRTAHEDRWRVLNGLCDFLRRSRSRGCWAADPDACGPVDDDDALDRWAHRFGDSAVRPLAEALRRTNWRQLG
jgi:hypothetical protein